MYFLGSPKTIFEHFENKFQASEFPDWLLSTPNTWRTQYLTHPKIWKINKNTKMFTKWVAAARKSLLTIAFCIIFRGAPHGDVDFGQTCYVGQILKNRFFRFSHNFLSIFGGWVSQVSGAKSKPAYTCLCRYKGCGCIEHHPGCT